MRMALSSSNSRDRTTEFHAIADRLSKSQSLSAASSSSFEVINKPLLLPQSSDGPLHVHSEFNRRASRIGLSIHQTSQKLSRLAKLAKRTSMFDDPAMEIQELTAVVKEDITALNAAISDLQVFFNSQNESGSRSKQSTEHSTTVVDNLKSRLMNTTKEFKEVLTMRTENLKVHESRRHLFSPDRPKDKVPIVRQRSTAHSNTPWANGSTTSSLVLSNPRRDSIGTSITHQAMEQSMVPLQDSYLQSRAEALQNVESTILELGSIFSQLATMVAQQGEIAIRIDENMDDTLNNVEGAQGALLKYLNRISSNRWLIMKIFSVLIFFLLIFVIFVA